MLLKIAEDLTNAVSVIADGTDGLLDSPVLDLQERRQLLYGQLFDAFAYVLVEYEVDEVALSVGELDTDSSARLGCSRFAGAG